MKDPNILGTAVIAVLIALFVPSFSTAQVVCGTANENGAVTLTAPPGHYFTSIEFASYGTPNGSCGSFTNGTCHAASSASICAAALVGNNSATINATNGVFGDPCVGTVKRLYVQATYNSLLPLTLTGFSVKSIDPHHVRLEWITEDEVNTNHFVIEKSYDGVSFDPAGNLAAAGEGAHNYYFIAAIDKQEAATYYRLKMVDRDGKHQYSQIVRFAGVGADGQIKLYQSSSSQSIIVNSPVRREASVYSSGGQLIRKFIINTGSSTITTEALPRGMYFLKAGSRVLKFIRR